MKRSGVICYCIVDCLTGCLCFHHCLDILSIERLGTAMPKAGKEWLQVGAYSCRTKPGLEKSSVVLYTDDAVNLAVHTGEKRVKKTFPVFFFKKMKLDLFCIIYALSGQGKGGGQNSLSLPSHSSRWKYFVIVDIVLTCLPFTHQHSSTHVYWHDSGCWICQISTLLCSWEQPVTIKTLFCHFQEWLSL